MEYVDRETGEVKIRIPIEVQEKRVEDMQTMYHEHLLNMLHRNALTKDYVDQCEREAQAVVDTIRWVMNNRDAIRDVAKRSAQR